VNAANEPHIYGTPRGALLVRSNRPQTPTLSIDLETGAPRWSGDLGRMLEPERGSVQGPVVLFDPGTPRPPERPRYLAAGVSVADGGVRWSTPMTDDFGWLSPGIYGPDAVAFNSICDSP
jgi:hypothetical protein